MNDHRQCLYHQAAKWREAAGVVNGNYGLEYAVRQSAYMSRNVYSKQWGRIIGRGFIFNWINKYLKGVFRSKEMWGLYKLFKIKAIPLPLQDHWELRGLQWFFSYEKSGILPVNNSTFSPLLNASFEHDWEVSVKGKWHFSGWMILLWLGWSVGLIYLRFP